MSGRDVFTPAVPHTCHPPGGRPVGSIWQCDCGRYFYVSDRHDGCAPPTYWWTPVRWWNRRQRRIVAADRKK